MSSPWDIPPLVEHRQLAAVVEQLRRASSILIAAHANPDGDTLGSSIALGLALRAPGRQTFLYCADPVPYNYHFLPGREGLSAALPPGPLNLIVQCDVSEPPRVSEAYAAWLKSQNGIPVIIVDHHLTAGVSGALTINDSRAAAVGELICDLINALGVALTHDMAVNLYASIISDTGGFRYANTTPRLLRVAAKLLELGVNPWEAADNIFERQPLNRIQLTAEMLATLEVLLAGRCAAITVTQEMFQRTGAAADATDNFINYPRSLAGVEVAAFFRELPDRRWKVSFRGRGRVNVGALAHQFGGGGHHDASGCTLELPLAEAKRRVFAAIAEILPG